MNDSIYETLPYPPMSFPQSHPQRLATNAALLGLTAPDVAHCRVLELGCATGANLVAMAHALPNSQFEGIDLAQRQIDLANARGATLGLANVQFRQQNILEVELDGKPYDYIIAHGVYSWTPLPVRDRILAICDARLAANGIAYVSYNTLPGWRQYQGIREMLRYRTKNLSDPAQITETALHWMGFLEKALENLQMVGTHPQLSAYKALIERRARWYQEQVNISDVLFLSDDLGEINEPVYFTEFMEHAARHHLQFVSEAALSRSALPQFPAYTLEYLMEISEDLIQVQQYMDFLLNRQFRETLLCRDDLTLQPLDAKRVKTLYVGSSARYNGQTTANDHLHTGADSAQYRTESPLTHAAFVVLEGLSPLRIAFSELFAAAYERVVGATPNAAVTEPEQDALAQDLLEAHCWSNFLIQLNVVS